MTFIALTLEDHQSLPAQAGSERETQRKNPTMVVLVERSYGDLQAAACGEAEPLRERKTTQDKSGGQENFLLSIQNPALPKRRILLEHRPDYSFDPIIHRRIKEDRPAQQVRARCGKIRTNRALNIPMTNTFRGCESGGQGGVTEAVGGRAGRQRSTKEKSHKVVALALRCRKRPELDLK